MQSLQPIINVFLGGVLGCAVALLKFTFELLSPPRDLLKIIVGEIRPFLPDLTFQLLPVAFNSIPIHRALRLSLLVATCARREFNHRKRARFHAGLVRLGAPPERFPIRWNHLIEKESPRNQRAGACSEKVSQLFRNMLQSWAGWLWAPLGPPAAAWRRREARLCGARFWGARVVAPGLIGLAQVFVLDLAPLLSYPAHLRRRRLVAAYAGE